MRHWVSYADGAYLSRLKALHASMLRHCQPFELDVLCWDDAVWDWAEKVGPTVVPTHIDYFLREHPELAVDKLPGPLRTHVEHMWSCGPAFIADTVKEVGPSMYVDADIMFFSSPEPVFAEIGDAPAAVFPHNFADVTSKLPGPTFQTHHFYGLYNVGLLYIAQEQIARDWAEETRQWCFDRVEASDFIRFPNGGVPIADRKWRYADQKNLDPWPEKYGAHVVFSRAAAVAPWNIHTRPLTRRDGVLYFGDEPLVSFHFSSLKLDEPSQLTRPEYQLTREQAEMIYDPYLRQVLEWHP